MELNFQKLHVEMDCKGVVGMLNDERKNLFAAGLVIEEVKALLDATAVQNQLVSTSS